MKDRGSVLVVGDIHMPFEEPGYLDFCRGIYTRCKCTKVILIGDMVDNHAISYHEHDPDGWSPADEMKEVDKHLKPWFKAFPEVFLTRGRHDALVDRKGKTVGLPRRCFKSYRDIWNLPKSWVDGFSFEFDGVRYQHGDGYSGDLAHIKAAYNNRQSTVIGHIHHLAATAYIANEKDCVLAMAVGCGIHKRSYAFAYGKDFKKKPIVSAGVVTDKGKYCQVFKMDL